MREYIKNIRRVDGVLWMRVGDLNCGSLKGKSKIGGFEELLGFDGRVSKRGIHKMAVLRTCKSWKREGMCFY
jgi:hypothetical protein